MSLPSRVTCVAFLLALAQPLAAEEVQSRGPVHEAFAQPPELLPRPALLVPKEPPAPLVELQPENRPAGENLRWVAGYWTWDAERKDFTWVSGFYRQAPADRQFVAGAWSKSEEGWRRAPGYWAPSAQHEPALLPAPPDSVDNGPDGAAPDERSTYRPGYWRYVDERFVWQPGGWAEAVDGRVWTNPRYQWDPRGYVFVDGYWDYPLGSRGQLLAPVSFTTIPANYRPNYGLGMETLTSNLFYKPGTGQYFFGDYFSSPGYQPWFAGAGRNDPLFGYYQWQYRTDPSWVANLEQSYQARARGAPAPVQILEGQSGIEPETPTALVPNPFNGGMMPGNPLLPGGSGYGRRPRGYFGVPVAIGRPGAQTASVPRPVSVPATTPQPPVHYTPPVHHTAPVHHAPAGHTGGHGHGGHRR